MEEADEMIVSEVFSEDFCMYYYKLNRETWNMCFTSHYEVAML
jgi:hypothetical protein